MRRVARRRLTALAITSLVLAGCTRTEAGQGLVALYHGPNLEVAQAHALELPSDSSVMAVSPDGRTVAVLNESRELCVTDAVDADQPSAGECVRNASVGAESNLVTFSPDGKTLAVAENTAVTITARLWFIDVSTLTVTPVPAGTASVGTSSNVTASAAATSNAAPIGQPTPLWVAQTWNPSTGHLVGITADLMSGDPVGSIVDVAPESHAAQTIEPAADQNQAAAGQILAIGDTAVYLVYPADGERAAHLVVADLVARTRRDLGVVAGPNAADAADSTLRLLALSPDGHRALLARSSPRGSNQAAIVQVDLDGGTALAVRDPNLGTVYGAVYAPDGSAFLTVEGQVEATTSLVSYSTSTMTRRVLSTVHDRLPGQQVALTWSRSNVVSAGGAGDQIPAGLSGWTLT